MANLDTLGDRLRYRRLALGLGARDVAQQLRASREYVQRVEGTHKPQLTGRPRPSRYGLLQWALALGADDDELAVWLQLADYDPALGEDEVAVLAATRPERWPLSPPGAERQQQRVIINVEDLQELQDRVRAVVIHAALLGQQGEATRLLDEYLKRLRSYLGD